MYSQCIEAVYCYKQRGLCVSVCLLITATSCAKTAGRIVLQFGLWTWVGPVKYELGWGLGFPREGAIFWASPDPVSV